MSRVEQAADTPGVCAILVTWQPDLLHLQSLLDALLVQHCPVLLIDNGSDNRDGLRALLQQLPPDAVQAAVFRDSNAGLATALNEGLALARQAGFTQVLLFDQDSLISEHFVSDMQQQWQQLPASPPPAALGPRLQDPETGRRTPFRCFRWRRRSDRPVDGVEGLYHTDFLISSGTLLSMAALDQTGLMKEVYFIDNIDLEWCFRVSAQGFALYGTDRAVLFHRIGEASRNPLVTSGILVQHSPLRSYYSTRNRIHLWRQPYAPLDWKVRDRIRFVLKSLWLVLFSARRREYWQHIRRGIKDARGLS